MTQPHYIDREAVELTSASEVWDFLASDGAIADWIRASTLTDSQRIGLGYAAVADRKDRRPAPMEAVAWREKVNDAVTDAIQAWRVPDFVVDGDPAPLVDMVCAPHEKDITEGLARLDSLAADITDAILQALAVIPTHGGEK